MICGSITDLGGSFKLSPSSLGFVRRCPIQIEPFRELRQQELQVAQEDLTTEVILSLFRRSVELEIAAEGAVIEHRPHEVE
jgi:hypothetical protein